MSESEVVSIARDYYNSDDADRFYAQIWGGEDIHIGFYESADEPIVHASHRTVAKIADKIQFDEETKVIDIGAGYGGAARYLAKEFGSYVYCLNLSEVQNQRNRDMNEAQNLANLIEVVDGSFEDIPSDASSFDVAWSQDAILHSGNRETVLAEVSRVLKPGGEFVFTDPMQSDNCPAGVLQAVLDRIHLSTMGSPDFYKTAASKHGMQLIGFEDHTQQLVNHYTRVREELVKRSDELSAAVSPAYIERMQAGLGHWITAGEKGYLSWGIFHFKKS